VLQYVFEGPANNEIADRLQVSESSVKATLQAVVFRDGRAHAQPACAHGVGEL